jgi:Flp pilus assembly protein TadD
MSAALAARERELLETQARLTANEARYQYNIGVLLAKSGDADKANAAFVECLALDPTDADAHYNLAALAKSRGDNTAALFHVNEYVRLRGGSAESKVAELKRELLQTEAGL